MKLRHLNPFTLPGYVAIFVASLIAAFVIGCVFVVAVLCAFIHGALHERMREWWPRRRFRTCGAQFDATCPDIGAFSGKEPAA